VAQFAMERQALRGSEACRFTSWSQGCTGSCRAMEYCQAKKVQGPYAGSSPTARGTLGRELEEGARAIR
jgi:hypothetical protein